MTRYPSIPSLIGSVLWACAMVLGGGTAMADDGYRLWLHPAALTDPALLDQAVPTIRVDGESATCEVIRQELKAGLQSLLEQETATAGESVPARALVAGTPATSGTIRQLSWADQLPALGDEGFAIRSTDANGGPALVIAANTDLGLLYGAYDLLRRLRTATRTQDLNVQSQPRIRHRLLNHWDNLDGSIERGYAGTSLWAWERLPDIVDPRIRDYARANASIGINGTVLNNVNADPSILTEDYLAKVAALADVLRPYGIHTYLSVNFASPIRGRFSLANRRGGGIGDLDSADPLDPRVRDWWTDKVTEIYRLIPDFGGFVVKANSEGMPGPQDYERTHAEGANMLAAVLAPHGGIVMWRAFVYSPSTDPDRAKRAYLEFVPLDGTFAPNVLVQAKNGPIDYQPREPVQPLFAAMPRTPLMLELQITQEYLGQANHLVFLAPMWKEYLGTDLTGDGTHTLARVIDGSAGGHSLTGIAGVANTGSDRNWCGHLFGQANWYAFGRLGWDPNLSADQLAEEWIRMTLGHDPTLVATVKSMMLGSWETCVNYMTPLGLHHIMEEGVHYGPGPHHDVGRDDWTSVYYHRADREGLGFDRSSHGSRATAQYPPGLRKQYDQLDTCPLNLLLWFHHVPWDHVLGSGRTLWAELQARYRDGAAGVDRLLEDWQSLQTRLDPEVYGQVAAKLRIQQHDAQLWKDTCLAYFETYRNPATWTGDGPGLAEAYADAFQIGCAVNDNQVRGLNPAPTAIIEREFNALTPENCLKWEHVHPAPGRFNFEPVDRLVELGERNGQFMVGHTLVWQNQTPAWVFRDARGQPADRETLLARMREHITTVVGRYRGRIHGWDVVNETFNSNGDYRDTPWFRIIGEDYLAQAFAFAHAADPEAELYYNDFNMYHPGKVAAVIRMAGDLRDQGIRLDGIGMQGHWALDYPSLGELEAAVQAYAQTEVPLVVSEMDITLLPNPDQRQGASLDRRATLTAALNPYPEGLPDEVSRLLSQRYAELFSFFLDHREYFSRVTLWGISDGQSWRNNWPVRGRTDYPLLFDRHYRPKPAYDAVKNLVNP